MSDLGQRHYARREQPLQWELLSGNKNQNTLSGTSLNTAQSQKAFQDWLISFPTKGGSILALILITSVSQVHLLYWNFLEIQNLWIEGLNSSDKVSDLYPVKEKKILIDKQFRILYSIM